MVRLTFGLRLQRVPSPHRRRGLLTTQRFASTCWSDSESPPTLPPLLRQRTHEIPLADSFDPSNVEPGWQQWWQTILQRQSSSHQLEPSRAMQQEPKRFSMILPPPNVTGALHIGHALTVTIQDALARWHKMKGFDVTWVPGLDHAGIATQSVVERKLFREHGLTRLDLGRDAFVQQVWHWNDQYGRRILDQIDRLGCIVNKDKHFFTLDAQRSKAVNEAFVRLHEKGLVYRRRRMVNWCPTLQTAISDIEVDAEQLEGSVLKKIPGCKRPVEFGVMHRILYQLADAPQEFLHVDTTRPETIFGDVAVAVHPDDERYKQFHGRSVLHPFSKEPIPIVTDATLVNMELGTGVVKVTPAHDPKDYECGLRHSLPEKQVINEKGQMCGDMDARFIGLDRFEARHRVIQALKDQGLYVEKLNHSTTLNICSRSGNVIEPLLKPQWFVDCSAMGKRASALVRSGQMPIEPPQHKHTWFYFLDNLHDWCVSRQLWWGHRIPAYKLKGHGDEWIVARDVDEALQKAQERFGDEVTAQDLEQDEDVLDTWFSSGLLPLSAFGWPEVDPKDHNSELSVKYPLTVMETGSDILFFWVARMAMLCQEFSGQQPFKKVLLHPMVRDKAGRKMSKSLGNVIDPIDVIHGRSLDDMLHTLLTGNIHDPKEVTRAQKELKREFPKGIPECGADALRLTLASYLQQGRQINMDVQRVISYRHFCNKVWNAFRYALPLVQPKEQMKKQPVRAVDVDARRDAMTLVDKWILSRVAKAVTQCNEGLETNQLAVCVSTIQRFFVAELCDVYVEFSKPVLYGNRFETDEAQQQAAQAVLHKCLDLSMRLLHPFAPFLTEELWQRLAMGEHGEDQISLLTAQFPEKHHVSQWINEEAESQMQMILDVVRAVRSLRHVLKTLAPTQNTPEVFVYCSDPQWLQVLESHSRDIQLQTRIEQLQFVQSKSSSSMALLSQAVSDQCQVLVQVPDDLETCQRLNAEIQRVTKKQTKLQSTRDQLQTRVQTPGYDIKVPAKVREQDAVRMLQLDQEITALAKSLSTLVSLRDQM